MAPSELHINLQERALTWLDNRVTGAGMRAATEVCLAQGYVADSVALCSMQNRFFQEYCDFAKVRPRTYHPVHRERYDGDINNYMACVFEVKVSMADFQSTFSANTKKHANRMEPIGSLHWVVAPKFTIKPEEVPDFWGLLISSHGGMRQVKPPLINQRTEAQMDKIAHNILWPMLKGRQTWTTVPIEPEEPNSPPGQR